MRLLPAMLIKPPFVSNTKPSRRFTKSQRLLNAAQFQNVFDNVNCKQGGKYFTFLSTTNRVTHYRLGLVIAKKHIRLAVDRNRVKRAIRESFRCLEVDSADAAKTSFDVIVLAKSSVNQLDKAQLNKELNRQWLRLLEKRKAL
jgi:ribonuclease P protein component